MAQTMLLPAAFMLLGVVAGMFLRKAPKGARAGDDVLPAPVE
jgi:hypothetical protein